MFQLIIILLGNTSENFFLAFPSVYLSTKVIILCSSYINSKLNMNCCWSYKTKKRRRILSGSKTSLFSLCSSFFILPQAAVLVIRVILLHLRRLLVCCLQEKFCRNDHKVHAHNTHSLWKLQFWKSRMETHII